MDERTKMIIIYDYYQNLLTDNQRKYFEDYYFNNYSLSEIAENSSISRGGVYKIIKSTENKLQNYEEKLELFKKRTILLSKIEKITDKKTKETLMNIMEEI